MVIRVVKRNTSFEGDASFSYVIQSSDESRRMWTDLMTITEELYEQFGNATWETNEDSVKYKVAELFQYTGN